MKRVSRPLLDLSPITPDVHTHACIHAHTHAFVHKHVVTQNATFLTPHRLITMSFCAKTIQLYPNM